MKCSTLLPVVLCVSVCAAFEPPRPLITLPIDDTQLITLSGNVYPLARPPYDRGPVPDTLVLPRLRLLLKRSAERQQAFEGFLSQLHDPASRLYHRWLTPLETGEQFGAAPQDVDAVLAWLRSHGFQTREVYPNRMAIEFTGTAAQVRTAFHTAIHSYVVKGEITGLTPANCRFRRRWRRPSRASPN